MLTDIATDPAPADHLLAAADLQDDLMTACNDLGRLQTLLADACDALMQSFHGAIEGLDGLRASGDAAPTEPAALHSVMQNLSAAVVALQFQDMGSQLIAHTHKRLRSCADRIANDSMGDDEDGATVIEEAPLRPNPVTQDEMDAGSVELF
jgi:hypothetical protein